MKRDRAKVEFIIFCRDLIGMVMMAGGMYATALIMWAVAG